MSDSIIKIKDLKVIYNQGKSNEVRSLDGVSLEIYPEEYVIIHGPSGCGKSTLLYSIAGLQSPTYGEVFVGGKDIFKMKKKEKVELHRSQIGLIFQAFYLIESISVIHNICMPKIFGGENKRKRKEEAGKLLRRFGIAEQTKKLPSQLSGGQKQRVAIARALINNPKIVLADEPVGNLDSESAKNVLEIMRELNDVDKKTIILVTHNDEHLHYADRVIHMKDGKIVGIDVQREKRPLSAVKEELTAEPEKVSSEMRILMRTFRDLSAMQLGVMLVPFKAKQLLSHVLSELTEEQINAAENILKEVLFKNIGAEGLKKNLDMTFEEGGANWNKQRANSVSERVDLILKQVEVIKNNPDSAVFSLSAYLIKLFGLHFEIFDLLKFRSALKLRIENKLDRFGLQQRLDSSKILGGMGLYKNTSEKIAREVEIIMLLKYSA